MSEYKPPFHMTDRTVTLLAEISEQVGRITVLQEGIMSPHLRRENRIRTIHSSLAIEHNSLSLDQVTAILNGKRVLGNPNEIKEVQNAYEAYEMMLRLNPNSVEDLLTAHKLMVQGLVPENGKFRSGGVGVFDGDRLVHMAPPAPLVPKLIQDLFDWYQNSEMHPLIKSAVFHYEFEFIHPFQDGNGRVGRLIMFRECLRLGYVPFIITDELKMFYYNGLRNWPNIKGYLMDTCLTAQDNFKILLAKFRIKYTE